MKNFSILKNQGVVPTVETYHYLFYTVAKRGNVLNINTSALNVFIL